MVKDCLAREGIELIPEDDSTPVQTQVEITKIQPCTKWCKLGSWLKETKGTEERTEKEIEDYLKDPTLDAESNPLEWWKVHAVAFPTLANKYIHVHVHVCVCAPVVHIRESLALQVMLSVLKS